MIFWRKNHVRGGYEKFNIFSISILGKGINLGVLKINKWERVCPHSDPVDNNRKFKININLVEPEKGGSFECKKFIFDSRRIKVYRADKYEHSTEVVREGKRLDLLIGIDL